MQSLSNFATALMLGVMLGMSGATAAECDLTLPKPPARSIVLCIQEYGEKLEELRGAFEALKSKVTEIEKAIYGDVDAVYTISESFTVQDIKKLGENKKILRFRQYIYADLDKHSVQVVVVRRQNFFSFLFCLNNVCTLEKNDINADVTQTLKEHPLKPVSAGGFVESKLLAFPEHIQLIEFEPKALTWEGGEVSSIDGYVLVRRKHAPAKPAKLRSTGND